MKTTIMIVENNPVRFFTARQLIESKLRMPLEIKTAESIADFETAVTDEQPDQLIYRCELSAMDLLQQLQRRGTNRRNTRIVFLVTPAENQNIGAALRVFAEMRHADHAKAA